MSSNNNYIRYPQYDKFEEKQVREEDEINISTQIIQLKLEYELNNKETKEIRKTCLKDQCEQPVLYQLEFKQKWSAHLSHLNDKVFTLYCCEECFKNKQIKITTDQEKPLLLNNQRYCTKIIKLN